MRNYCYQIEQIWLLSAHEWRRRGGSNSRAELLRPTGLANPPLHRLGYSSLLMWDRYAPTSVITLKVFGLPTTKRNVEPSTQPEGLDAPLFVARTFYGVFPSLDQWSRNDSAIPTLRNLSTYYCRTVLTIRAFAGHYPTGIQCEKRSVIFTSGDTTH